MLRKHIKTKNKSEYGFTLIELLVVIIIIGILAAIAIPAFLNQRQRANEVALKSDIRNVVMGIETLLVEKPNAVVIYYNLTGGIYAEENIRVSASNTGRGQQPTHLDIPLSDGVKVRVAPAGTTVPGQSGLGSTTADASNYQVEGHHPNVKQHNNTARRMIWHSPSGRFVT